ncbi:MotA/TolQ/ExbB proton channel family protein [Algiphilus sp.]|uniref:MotA/TolQ/ExbB proton channel family protein n=1 Tax=Algiphilus sp. TaxID=1872431 RepID=UPI003B523CDD
MRWLMTLLAALLSFPLFAQSEAALLEKVRTGQLGPGVDQSRQLQAFRNAPDSERAQLLEVARARRDQLQADSRQLEERSRANDKIYEEKINALRAAMGPNAAMFGTLLNLSDELIGVFRNASTTLQYPEREAWLTAFKARMEKASEIFSVEELEHLWFLMQQEITAAGQIVSLSTEVLGESGTRENREVVRIGKFGLISADPEPAYLSWDPAIQRATRLQRQPEGGALRSVEQYLSDDGGTRGVAIDPTGGSLLSRLVDAPSIRDRIEQGGLIGKLIIVLGLVGVAVAIAKLVSIALVSAKVAAQQRNLHQPRDDNPLGRMMQVYERNQAVDTETLEMRLGEAILEERPKVDRYIGFIKVIAAVAPLMGLMGTVIGMIATFQAITLFGTGDPKTMAGGISQALVTTVLGLTVAIPTVLLHALVSARAASLVNTLKHQTAGLIAERMESQAARS